MRVLHLASGTDYGGAKTHIFTLLAELRRHIDVTLACFSGGPFLEEARGLGLDACSLGQVTRYDLFAIGRLQRLVKARAFDVVHCHGPRSNVLAVLSRRRLGGRPLVTTVHSDWRKDFAESPVRNLVFGRMNAWALRHFDRYLVLVGVEASIRELGVDASLIRPVRNGLDFGNRPAPPPRAEVLSRLGLRLPPQAVIIGIVARLHPVKSHEVFLAGAARVARINPDAHFLIAGDGGMRPALERLADRLGLSGHTHFVGHVDNTDDVFSILDVNCLTSFSEAQPYALLEGARWGVATVSSRIGGVPELIVDGSTGYLFTPGDVDGFSERLAELAGDPAKRRELGRRLYEHGRRNFSTQAMAGTYLAAYREILDGRQPSHAVPG